MISELGERRKAPRTSADWGAWMTLEGSGAHYYAVSRDISSLGAQFAGPLLVEPKERLHLSFHDEPSDVPVQCQGQVRWTHLADDGQWHFGVEFTEIEEPAKSRLAQFVQA